MMRAKKIDYIYISAGENICWLLNIESALPNSPVANCKIILTNKKQIYFANYNKIKNIRLKLKKFKIFLMK